ncbi:MAG TPA: DUF3147 family protein [Acidobacteriaceae bacterium]|jgi:hypothetical protein
MKIRMDFASLAETRPHEYGLRFFFGGMCTALAGLIAKRYGPAVGGLFLAFPAIFPAAASLIQTHEKRRKAEIGSDGTRRGENAASLDAFGATLGCLGLIGFALCLWRFVTAMSSAGTLALTFTCWTLVAGGAYFVRRHWPRPHAR